MSVVSQRVRTAFLPAAAASRRHLVGDALAGVAVCVCWMLALGVALCLAQPAQGTDEATEPAPSAGEIIGRVVAREQGRDQVAKAVWRLVSDSGRVRERETRFYRREEDGDASQLLSRWLLVFDSPPDVRDTALLVWNPRRPAEGAEQWMYLSGLRKVRRIAGSVRGTSFMGTDFAFEDLSERAADQDEHALLRREDVEGVEHFVIESTPKPGSSVYTKRVQWVNPVDWTQSRVDFYGTGSEPEKSMRFAWQRVGDVLVWKRLEMRSLRTGHHTVIDVQDVQIDTGLREDVFQPSALARGGR